MDINRLFSEIWAADTHWTVGKDIIRGVYMFNTFTSVGLYGDSVEEVARKVWLMIYGGYDIEVLPASYGMVKG